MSLGATPKYLVLFYGVSSGANGANLGSDERDLVTLVYLVLNTEENKIVGIHKYPVAPTGSDINENILSEEVTQDFGIQEVDVKGAPPLSYAIHQFDILARDVLGGGDNFRLVTDGQQHLRQCLYPEAVRKNISLPSYYQRFHDLRKEFSSLVTGSGDNVADTGGGNSVEEMLKTLDLPEDNTQEMALRTVNNMAKILQKMFSEGKKLHDPEVIQMSLEPGIRSRSEQVDGSCVVRARGLPWQASDTEVARFFTGLNVAPGGVALCLSPQGRRNGEALVLLESVAHRDMALRRHKHHIGNRYIEVYKATGEDFISIAGVTRAVTQLMMAYHPNYMVPMFSIPQVTWANQSIGQTSVGRFPNPKSVMRICNNTEAQEFLNRGGQVIIRMRGLPYDCSAKQVIEFFNNGEEACDVLDEEGGVLFVKKPDGRATGDAFVLFKEEAEGDKALLKHKEIIGSRYIELFRSTTAEVQQVLNRSTEHSSKSGSGSGLINSVTPGPGPLLPSLPVTHHPSGQHPGAAGGQPMTVIPQQLITAGTRRDCIRLRGLPYEAQVEHILEFLEDHAKNIVYQGVHMVFNAQGQPSGEAFIQMDSEASAFGASNNKHHLYMVFGKKKRYIEVFQCSGEDMNVVLTGSAGGASGGKTQQPPLLSPGGPAHYPAYSGLLPRPGSHPPHSPFPPQLVYWPGPGCGYPSPPISPTNYFLPQTPGPASASLCLTPTSSLSSLSNGVTSPGPGPGHAPPSGHSSPPLPLQPNNLPQLTVETVTPVKFVRGAMSGERHNNQSLLRSSVYIH